MVAYSYLNIYGVKKFVILGRIVWNDCWLFIFLKQARDNSKIPVNIHKIRRHHIEEGSNFASQYISKL
jgi:hypothetical protein